MSKNNVATFPLARVEPRRKALFPLSFLHSFASVIDLTGCHFERQRNAFAHSLEDPSADELALRSDWGAVGGDLWRAFVHEAPHELTLVPDPDGELSMMLYLPHHGSVHSPSVDTGSQGEGPIVSTGDRIED